MLDLFPIVAWQRIDIVECNRALINWEHFLGACNRPFGSQAFGLLMDGELVSVAMSCSTTNKRCAGFDRGDVVELARLCTRPDRRDLTRVALRLWRITAPKEWQAYWPVRAMVSYADKTRHNGDIYRFDGWRKAAEVKGGTVKSNWGKGRTYNPKSVWVYEL